MMTIKERIAERRQAIRQFEHNKPLIRASNCMGGKISATWGIRATEPDWLKMAPKKPITAK
ncbi:MAG: hypothetical protein LKF01_00275 [Lactobacillus sp.]|jgi:hypothetical protein|nr:hypothetical protein [Lactobacillus sp.]MCH4067979.1 hypothetical protein [Lactobacillus sp.]MCI1304065.1 hypothetical protein [Lactobacillus sp.]MCI1329909.1 hypothetical protein [Lactobacillus sp.]MCI1399509.1 hypothetical protein [Lactobacillus sp.]